jgi:hypothetical protein
MPEWSGLVNTTIHKYIRGEEVNVLRNRKLTALLMEKGRYTYNHSGDLMDWKVRYKQVPMQGLADADTLTFARQDKHKTAQLPWRGYGATDAMTSMEKEKNKSSEAIIKRYAQIAPTMLEDVEEQFSEEFYKDGNAAGAKGIHGFESFFGNSGASGLIGTPSDTYAELSTVLGNYGGSWTGTWPTGTGDSHYDFWSPLLVNYTNSGWTPTTDTWPNTCLEALRFGIIKVKKNKSKRSQMDLIILNDELYRQFLDKLQTEEQLNVVRGQTAGSQKAKLYDLGFTDVINFDGVDVTSEYGIASNVGYGICTEAIEICSLQKELFVPRGPDYDMGSRTYRFSIEFMGNMKVASPRNFCKWLALG